MMGREWILVVSLAVFIGVGAFNSWADKTSKVLALWSSRYVESLGQSMGQLTSKTTSLVGVDDLIKDIESNQQNGLKGALDRFLSAGDLQELRIVDTSCRQLSESKSVSFGIETCRAGLSQGFYWMKSPKGSVLVYEHPINDSYKVTAGVLVDRHWLVNSLGPGAGAAGLELTDDPGHGISVNRSLGIEPYFVWNHWSSLLTHKLIGFQGSRVPLAPFGALVVLFTLFLTAHYRRILLEQNLKSRRLMDQIQRFLVPWQMDSRSRDWPEDLQKKMDQQTQNLKEEIGELKDSLSSLRAVKSEIELELRDLQQSETVLDQIQRTIPTMVEHISTWEGKLRTLHQDVSTVLVRGSLDLAKLASEWQTDMEIRGPRKFLRSRIETEIPGPDGNQLTSELKFIVATAKGFEVTGGALQSSLGDIKKIQTSIVRIANFWKSILNGGSRDQHYWKISDAIEDSFIQVKMAMKDCQMVIEKPNWSEPLLSLEATYPTMTSIIHQIFAAFAKIDSNAKIDIQFRSGALHDQLVFTHINGLLGWNEGLKQTLIRHINTANSFGKPYGTLLRQLPTQGNHLVLAVAWKCSTQAASSPLSLASLNLSPKA